MHIKFTLYTLSLPHNQSSINERKTSRILYTVTENAAKAPFTYSTELIAGYDAPLLENLYKYGERVHTIPPSTAHFHIHI